MGGSHSTGNPPKPTIPRWKPNPAPFGAPYHPPQKPSLEDRLRRRREIELGPNSENIRRGSPNGIMRDPLAADRRMYAGGTIPTQNEQEYQTYENVQRFWKRQYGRHSEIIEYKPRTQRDIGYYLQYPKLGQYPRCSYGPLDRAYMDWVKTEIDFDAKFYDPAHPQKYVVAEEIITRPADDPGIALLVYHNELKFWESELGRKLKNEYLYRKSDPYYIEWNAQYNGKAKGRGRF